MKVWILLEVTVDFEEFPLATRIIGVFVSATALYQKRSTLHENIRTRYTIELHEAEE